MIARALVALSLVTAPFSAAEFTVSPALHTPIKKAFDEASDEVSKKPRVFEPELLSTDSVLAPFVHIRAEYRRPPPKIRSRRTARDQNEISVSETRPRRQPPQNRTSPLETSRRGVGWTRIPWRQQIRMCSGGGTAVAPRRRSGGDAPQALGIGRRPSATPFRRTTALKESLADLKQLQKDLPGPPGEYFDPLSLGSMTFDWGPQGEEATVGWLRHSEIKHGRVAMAGFLGFVAQCGGRAESLVSTAVERTVRRRETYLVLASPLTGSRRRRGSGTWIVRGRGRGAAAAGTWTVRGRVAAGDLDSPWTSRGGAAAGTWIVRGPVAALLRLRRG